MRSNIWPDSTLAAADAIGTLNRYRYKIAPTRIVYIRAAITAVPGGVTQIQERFHAFVSAVSSSCGGERGTPKLDNAANRHVP